MVGNPQELIVRGEQVERVFINYVDRRYIVNRRYQRKLIWTIEEKQSFIDSIMKGYPVPIVLLAEPAGKRDVGYEPTFPKWPAVWRQGRLILPAGQAFFAPSGVCGRASCWNRADRPGKPLSPGPGAVFFSAAGRPVLLLSFSLGVDRGHAHSGGARNRRMAARMARTIAPVTATSASWKVMARA